MRGGVLENRNSQWRSRRAPINGPLLGELSNCGRLIPATGIILSRSKSTPRCFPRIDLLRRFCLAAFCERARHRTNYGFGDYDGDGVRVARETWLRRKKPFDEWLHGCLGNGLIHGGTEPFLIASARNNPKKIPLRRRGEGRRNIFYRAEAIKEI